jgi:hypothetical protein
MHYSPPRTLMLQPTVQFIFDILHNVRIALSISSTYQTDLLEEPKQLDISLVPTSDEYVICFIGQYEMASADQMPCSKLISYLYHFLLRHLKN